LNLKPKALQRCQVETPYEIVDLTWNLARSQRNNAVFDRVIDLGAGDARFSSASFFYNQYVGLEVDKSKMHDCKLPSNAQIINADAMKWNGSDFDLCIGNPPYIRHHNLDSQWRSEVLSQIFQRSGVKIKHTANLFILFLMQALLCTHEKGLVVQIVPFEWITRPSARELRDYIASRGWDVMIFRFEAEIFPRVLTTASVTIIDKVKRSGQWSFAEIDKTGEIKTMVHPSGYATDVLPYLDRQDDMYGLRGLSPGGQDIFVLTEEERLYFSLKKNRDVVPCITSLRSIPDSVLCLDAASFNKFFVSAGKRCWLIKSDNDSLSRELQNYLDSVGNRWEKYSTCTNRQIWWRYPPHPIPALLISSGFVGSAPKVLLNLVGSVAAGSVYGIILRENYNSESIAKKLRKFNFAQHVVAHSNNLKKIEVKQLNSVLEMVKG
jgi:hypothetical protein